MTRFGAHFNLPANYRRDANPANARHLLRKAHSRGDERWRINLWRSNATDQVAANWLHSQLHDAVTYQRKAIFVWIVTIPMPIEAIDINAEGLCALSERSHEPW